MVVGSEAPVVARSGKRAWEEEDQDDDAPAPAPAPKGRKRKEAPKEAPEKPLPEAEEEAGSSTGGRPKRARKQVAK